MRTYTEEEMRACFQAGIKRGEFLERDEYAPFYKPLDEGDFIESLNPIAPEEEKIDFSYGQLRRKLDWTEFCDLTGVGYYAKNEGYEIKDTDTFSITESKAKEFNLI